MPRYLYLHQLDVFGCRIIFINHMSCYNNNNGEKNASCIKTKKSRLLKAKEKKSCAATIKDLPVKIVLPLDSLPDLRPRERSIPLHGVTCSSTSGTADFLGDKSLMQSLSKERTFFQLGHFTVIKRAQPLSNNITPTRDCPR